VFLDSGLEEKDAKQEVDRGDCGPQGTRGGGPPPPPDGGAFFPIGGVIVSLWGVLKHLTLQIRGSMCQY